MWLTRLAIRRPVTVTMGLVSLLVLGAISLGQLPLSFLPQAEFPFIGVYIPYPDGVPSQVEREIARPVEEVLATLGGVNEVFSYSDADQCWVGVEFEWGRDVNLLRMEVKEKLDQIRPELPSDIREMLLFTFNTNDMPVVEGRISAKDRDLSESYDLINHRVLNRLRRVPGVGRVEVDGVEPADVSIYLELDKIKEHKVDVGRLFDLLSQNNFNLTVGQITDDGLRYDVRTMGSVASLDELENLPLGEEGLRLKDVAEVLYGSPALTYGRFLNLEPAVAFWVQKSSGVNTVELVEGIKAELEEINKDPALDGVDVLLFFDQGEQITNSIRGLTTAGAVGSTLAIVVLYFFLRRIGTTLIVALAIPLSIVGTACFLYFSGRSLNVLSMMGLMLGVGMLIDNAVVVLESIYRHMSEGMPAKEATIQGTREVGRAVVSATLTSIIVFAPVVFGAQNELMVWLQEVGVTISITLVFSLLISLTVIPLLTAHVLKGGRNSVAANPLVDRWTGGYERVLRWTAVKHPWVTGIWIGLAILVITGVAIGMTGFGPEPDSDRGIRRDYMTVRFDFADNLDYRQSKVKVETAQKALWEAREAYDFEYVYAWYMDNHAMLRLYLEDANLTEERMAELRSMLREDLPEQAGVAYMLGDEQGGGGGAQGFSLTLYGEDHEELLRMAEEVKRRTGLIPDVTDLRTDAEEGADEVQVRVDPERARRYGLSPSTVAEIMGITFRGVRLPRVEHQGQEVDMWVLLQPEDRRSIENLQAMTVSVNEGREVTLRQVADIYMEPGADQIRRLNQKTAVVVRGSYEGEDFGEVLEEIGASMGAMHFPAGYGWNFGSEIREAQEQQTQMLVNMLLAILCVYMVMASLFESLLHPLVVMFCMPFASIGVIWLMILTNTPFNIMAMIGMVILIGVVVNNGIVLIDHVNHYRREGLSVDEAVVRGGRERFRPILMTATTTVLGLIPLAMGGSAVGNAEMYPMARAIIGGLLSSTVLTLVMLPTYYQMAERSRGFLPALWRAVLATPSAVRAAPGAIRALPGAIRRSPAAFRDRARRLGSRLVPRRRMLPGMRGSS